MITLSRTAAAALAALMVASSAAADVKPFFTAGDWTAVDGTAKDGTEMCGVSTAWNDHGSGARYFGIKHFVGNDHLTVHVARDGWKIPDGQRVLLTFQFDSVVPWTATATGHGNFVEVHVEWFQTTNFLTQFRQGALLTIRFAAGQEGTWRKSLEGSSAAAAAFADCILRLNPVPRSPTPQPFDKAPAGPAKRL